MEDPGAIKGKRVLVIEDGPTLTHGEMAYGAGVVAARRFDAKEIVDPRPYAKIIKAIKIALKQFRVSTFPLLLGNSVEVNVTELKGLISLCAMPGVVSFGVLYYKWTADTFEHNLTTSFKLVNFY